MIAKMYYGHAEPETIYDCIYMPDEVNLKNQNKMIYDFFEWWTSDLCYEEFPSTDYAEGFAYWINKYKLKDFNSKDKAYVLSEEEKSYIQDFHFVIEV